MSILEVSAQLRRKLVSPVELTEQCLARIEKFNPLLNAFITVTGESALGEARAAEAEIQRGQWRGPLHGIPIGLKDIIDTRGVPTTAASALFKDRVPAADAELVRKLRDAGAIFLGKQNLHEFAYGGSSIISYFGEVRNPWNTAHMTGGSSGGSAAAVAAGLCYAAIGTDTAGSVREPASECGVVGLKPTYGSVSLDGVVPLSWSLDHVGPLTGSVADAGLVFDAIAHEGRRPAPQTMPGEGKVPGDSRHLLRAAVPRAYFFDDLDPEVSKAVDEALSILKTLVREIREVILAVNADRSLQAAESYAYHAAWVFENPELYDPETLRRIRTGEKFTSEDRLRLSRELAQERHQIRSVFDEVDVLITPTVPIPPPAIAALRQNSESLRPTELFLLRNTRPFNVWGLPAISIPCGFTKSGLPIGLQIAGPHWGEQAVIGLAHAYEQATDWHHRKPTIG